MCVWIKNTSELLKGAFDVGTHSSADEVAKKSNFTSQNPQRQIWGGGDHAEASWGGGAGNYTGC